ncbi:hypothetical protein BG005_008431 [Podila minutissima]|nr:hypothetical protein BG005_008431 [Podila minutissima]
MEWGCLNALLHSHHHFPRPTTTTTTSISTMSRQGYTRLPDSSDVTVTSSETSTSTSSARPVLHNVASTPRSASASRAHVLESLVPLSKTSWSSVPTIIYMSPSKIPAKADASGLSSTSASSNTKH